MFMAESAGEQSYTRDAVKHSTISRFCLNFEALFSGFNCH